jgi:hypothetical protein
MVSALQQNKILGSVAALAATQNTVTAGNGTAATPSAGTRAIVATTDQTSTTNAITGIIAELNLVKADIAALLARVNGTG